VYHRDVASKSATRWVLALLVGVHAAWAVPARATAQVKAKSCAARCRHERPVSCESSCCFVQAPATERATARPADAPPPALGVAALPLPVVPAPVLRTTGHPLDAHQRAGPLYLSTRSLRL
jgi:hypothetical protein